MPACKNGIAHERLGDSYLRRRSSDFCGSEQAERWRSVLHSKDLYELARAVELRIAFFAFPHLYPYLDWFAPPAHLEVLHLGIMGSLEGLFDRARILLTDDSSVALDMAVLDKPIVYFRALGFQVQGSGVDDGRSPSPDSAVDGSSAEPAPICETEDELINALERLIKSDRHRECEERGRETMALRNPGRRPLMLEALLSLDPPDLDAEAATRRLIEAAELASEAAEWGLAVSRWRRVMGLPEGDRPSHAKLRLVTALRELGERHPSGTEETSTKCCPE